MRSQENSARRPIFTGAALAIARTVSTCINISLLLAFGCQTSFFCGKTNTCFSTDFNDSLITSSCFLKLPDALIAPQITFCAVKNPNAKQRRKQQKSPQHCHIQIPVF